MPTVPIKTWGTTTNLVWSSGSNSPVSVTITNLTVATTNTASDGMLHTYLTGDSLLVWDYDENTSEYIYKSADPEIVVSHLPPGTYDVYAYGLGSSYDEGGYGSDTESFQVLTSGGYSSGTLGTFHPGNLNTNWQRGVQYVRFSAVTVATNQTLRIKLFGNGNMRHIANGVQIISTNNNTAPTVTLTTPTNSTQQVSPGYFWLSAEAGDTDGNVEYVQFFHGSTLIGSVTNAPYQMWWNSVTNGTYSLTAKSFDNNGTSTTSSSVSVTVVAPEVPPVDKYVITDLGKGRAYGVNNFGQVVGEHYELQSGLTRAFLWTPSAANATNGVIVDIVGTNGTSHTYGLGMNSRGWVVGKYDITLDDEFGYPGTTKFGFVWNPPTANATNGLFSSLGTLAGYPLSLMNYSMAEGINDEGRIVGEYSHYYETYYGHALSWEAGATTDLGAFPGWTEVSKGIGVNEGGQVVGLATVFNGETYVYANHAVIWTNGSPASFVDLDPTTPDGSTYSEARAINALGLIVGIKDGVACVWTNQTADSLISLGVLSGKSESYARGVNNHGVVVGHASSGWSGDTYRAFVYDNENGYGPGRLRDLNSLLVTNAGWTALYAAEAISDNGQIVGYGRHSDGQIHAFLLTPHHLVTNSLPQFSVTLVTATNGAGATNTALAVTVNDSNPSGKDVKVKVKSGKNDGSSTAPVAETVTIAGGTNTAVIPATTANGIGATNTTSSTAVLGNSGNGRAQQSAATVKKPDVTISVYTPNPMTIPAAVEGDTNQVHFRVSLSQATTEALTINYTISGTASNGVDYTAITNYIVIPAYYTEGLISITPTNDSVIEGPESVVIVLEEDNSKYKLRNQADAAVMILDNDTMAEVPYTKAVVVRYGPHIHYGRIMGSLRQLEAEDSNFSGHAVVDDDYLVPGYPSLSQGGSATIGSVFERNGSYEPSYYTLNVNGNTSIGRLVMRANPISLPTVDTPPSPSGSSDVTINSSGQSVNYSTLRHLTVAPRVGNVSMPAGTYGEIFVDRHSTLVLGTNGTTTNVYNFSTLKLANFARVQVLGPVSITISNRLYMAPQTIVGNSTNATWLTVRLAGGGVELFNRAAVYGTIEAPNSMVNMGVESQIRGGLYCNDLSMQRDSIIEPREETSAPTFTAPVAVNDTYDVYEDEAFSNMYPPGILANDTDAEEDGLTAILVSNVSHGTLTLYTNGVFSYTPDANFYGTDSFTYRANDGLSNSAPATVTINVINVNDMPTLADVSNLTFNEDAVPQTIYLTNITSGASNESQTLYVSGSADNPYLLNSATVNYTSPNNYGTITISAVANEHGSTGFAVTVEDDGGGENYYITKWLTITVNSVNDAPTLNTLTNLTIDQNASEQTVNLAGISTGAENEEQTLTVTATSSNTGLIPHPTVTYTSPDSTGSISFTPVTNAFGTATITVTVADGGGTANGGVATVTRTFVVTVNAVNAQPTLGVIGDLTILEDAGLQTVYLTNITSGATNETQELTVTAVSSNPSLIPDPTATYSSAQATGSISFASVTNLSGTATITVTVDDGQPANNTVVRTFVVTVDPVNDVPTLAAIADLTILEDAGVQLIGLTNITSGATNESQTLTVTAVSSNPSLIPNPTVAYTNGQSTGSISYASVTNLSGTATITVTVDDGIATNNTVVRTFLVTVNPVNDLPTLATIGDLTILEDAGVQLFGLTNITSGAANEAEELTVTAVSSNPSLIPNPTVAYTNGQSTGSLSFAAVTNLSGTATITVTVDDGIATNNTVVRTFVVTVNAVNDVPTLAVIGDLTILEDAGLQVVGLTNITSGASNEEQELTVTAVSSNPGLIPDPTVAYTNGQSTGSISFASVSNMFGTATITVTVDDGIATNNAVVRTFLVTVTGVNDAPTLAAISDLNLEENAAEQTVNLTGVSAGNAHESQVLTVTATSSDTSVIPHPSVTYASANTTGSIKFTPVTDASGIVTITVTLTDDGGTANGGVNTTQRTFTVNVNAVNNPPTLASIGDLTILEDAGVQLVGLTNITSGATNETQTLTVTAVSSNPGLIPDPTMAYTNGQSTGSISFASITNMSGSATITVTVNDGGATNNTIVRTFVVTVDSVNDVPTLATVGDLTILEDAGLQLVGLTNITSGAVNESQALTVTATSSNTGLIPHPSVTYTSAQSTGSISFASVTNMSGTATITVTVNDDGATNNAVVRTFVITVNPVNDAPLVNAGSNQSVIYPAAASLVGTRSDDGEPEGSTLTNLWTKISGPGTVTFGNATNLSTTATFGAAGDYVLRLTVSDGDLSGYDELTVSVLVNQAPVVNAGTNQTLVWSGTGAAPTASPLPPPVNIKDSRGTNFWFAFSENIRSDSETSFLRVSVSSQSNTFVNLAIPGIGHSTTFEVEAGKATTVTLPYSALVLGADVIRNLGVHVYSTNEVSVYGHNIVQYSTDSFMVLPTDVTGTNYVVGAYVNGLYNHPESMGYTTGSQFVVVAQENNTTVTIKPVTDVSSYPAGVNQPPTFRAAGVPFTITLQQGQVYQLQDNAVFYTDLTGTTVTADKPVSVFGGHLLGVVPLHAVAADHICEQMVPVPALGKKFVVMPLATRLVDDLRVVASEDDTEVYVNGLFVTVLSAGQFYEQMIVGGTEIVTTKPASVFHYSVSSSIDSAISDPFMLSVPPYEQFQSDYTVATAKGSFSFHYLNVIVRAEALGKVLLDGAAIPAGQFRAINNSGFFGAQLKVSEGGHRLSSRYPFGLTVYGFGDYDSYGYTGGTSISSVGDVNSLALSPKTGVGVLGDEHSVVATVLNASGAPLSGIRVDFSVTGANELQGSALTDAAGQATFIYTAATIGTDDLVASVSDFEDTATMTWYTPYATLSGGATDDGLPTGSSLNYQWSFVSGPAGATITDTNAAITTAGFLSTGTYVFRLVVSDGELTGTNQVTIDVVENLPATVTAGSDQSISLPSGASLAGWVANDSYPSGIQTTQVWSQISGPGEVIFVDASVTNTTAYFSQAGRYLLRLTAHDSLATSYDEVVIDVLGSDGTYAPVTTLLNVNFGGGLKVGTAFTGFSTNDYWNVVTASSLGTTTNLKWFDQRTSSVSITVSNFPSGTSGSGDPMLGSYIWGSAFDYEVGSTPSLLVMSNLPPATYDLVVYYPPGSQYDPSQAFDLYLAGVHQGTRTALAAESAEGLPMDPYAEGVHYVTFTNLVVTTNANLAVMMQGGGYDNRVSGLQLIPARQNRPVVITSIPSQTLLWTTNAVPLIAGVSDDGPVESTWSFVSGPGSVAMTNTNAIVDPRDAQHRAWVAFEEPGSYTFKIVATDGYYPATNTVVIHLNRPPVAVADSITVPENHPLNPTFATAGYVFSNAAANDSDPDGDTVRVTGVGTAQHGRVRLDYGSGIIFYAPDRTFTGTDTFRYTVGDSKGGYSSAIVTVTVTDRTTNAPPVASADLAFVDAGGNVTISPLDNDSDPNGDLLYLTNSVAGNGQVVKTLFRPIPDMEFAFYHGQYINYKPSTGYFGIDTIHYIITDHFGGSSTGLVTVYVNEPGNQHPVANEDTIWVANDGLTHPIYPLANDTDTEGNARRIVSFTMPDYGTLAPVYDGTGTNITHFTFQFPVGGTPNGVFTYTIVDSRGGVATGTVTVQPNGPVYVVNDFFTTNEDTTLNVTGAGVLGAPSEYEYGDIDFEGDPITISLVAGTTNGIVTLQTNGQFTYVPNPNFHGTDTFTYRAYDGYSYSSVATVTLTIEPVNDVPVGVADTLSVFANTTNNVLSVLANDTDVDGDALTLVSVGTAGHGTVSVYIPEGESTGTSLHYSPATNFYGKDTFMYVLTDGAANVSNVVVTVYVNKTNNIAPVALPDFTQVWQDSGTNIIYALDNDTDENGDPLKVESAFSAANGTVFIATDGSLLGYQPDEDFYGIDTFQYVVTDNFGGADTETVHMFVNHATNTPPVAYSDNKVLAQGSGAVTVNVLTNDLDIDVGQTLVLYHVATPRGGSLTFTNGVVTYTPATNFYGVDVVSYIIHDGFGGMGLGYLNFYVNKTGNTAPVAVADALYINKNSNFNLLSILANDTDAEGNLPFLIYDASAPTNGVLHIALDGSFIAYTPLTNFTGTDSFVYWMADTNGGVSTNTVTLTVIPGNTVPSPVADTFYVVQGGSVTNLHVLANDTDADTNALTIVSVTTNGMGGVSITSVSGTNVIAYTPPTTNYGVDSFRYYVSDGQGGTNSAVVTVHVRAVSNDDPVAVNDTLTVTQNSLPTAINVLTNDTDANGHVLYLLGYSGPAHGTITIDGGLGSTNGVIRYTPDVNYTGSDSLTYFVGDAFGGIDMGTLTVTITADTSAAPVALIGNLTNNVFIREGLFDLTGAAYDPDVADAVGYKVLLYTPNNALDPQHLVADITPGPDGSGYHPTSGIMPTNALGTLDFTMVRNGSYDLVLLVKGGSKVAYETVRVLLNSNLKIGQFTFSQQDLVIPVNGLPLTVVRTYDSLNNTVGEFGHSWTYALNEAQVELDEFREETVDFADPNDATFSMRGGGGRNVTLTLPDGRRVTFEFYYKQTYNAEKPWVEARFRSPVGVYGTLGVKGDNRLVTIPTFPPYWYNGDPRQPHESYDFPGFYFTNKDGTVYVYEREDLGIHDVLTSDYTYFGIQSYGQPYLSEIRQRSGDVIKIFEDAIQHYNPSGQITRQIVFQRDGAGRIVAITDPNGLSTNGIPNSPPAVKYLYDTKGNLEYVLKLVDRATTNYLTTRYIYGNTNFPHFITEIVDPRGITPLKNIYDSQGRLYATVDANNKTNYFTHNLASRTSTIYDRLGNPTQYFYDKRGNTTMTIDALNNATTRLYDERDNLLAETNALGHVTRYGHDGDGNLTLITAPYPEGADTNRYTTRFTYNAKGKQTSVTSPSGAMRIIGYDDNGNVVSLSDEEGNIIVARTYDSNGDEVAEADHFGTTLFAYDQNGNLTHSTNIWGEVTVSSHNPNGEIVSITERGVTSTFEYDAAGRETSVDYGNGITVNYGHGEFDTWTSVSGPTVGAMQRTMDNQGRLSGWVIANGGSIGFAYDDNGRLLFETNSVGRVKNYTYDAVGRAVAVNDLTTGASTKSFYDAVGRRIIQTNALGYVSRFAYNPDGSLAYMTNALGGVWQYLYDLPAGCCGGFMTGGQTIDPLGRVTTQVTSPHGLPLETIYPDSTRVAYTYLLPGAVDQARQYPTTITDEGNHIRSYGYDQLNQLTNATDLGGNGYRYLQMTNRLVSIEGPDSQQLYGYTYNSMGNPETITYSDGGVASVSYGTNNKPISIERPGGVAVSMQYDHAQRVTNRTSTLGEYARFAYNTSDVLTNMVDNTGITSYLHDAAGRRYGINYPSGAQVRYGLDVMDRITNVTARASSGGTDHVTSYEYDALGNVSRVIDPVGGVTDLEYDDASRVVQRTLPNGVVTTYEYNLRDQVTNIIHSKSSVVIASVAYVRQGVGEPVQIIREDGSYINLAYDSAHRLTNEVHHAANHSVTHSVGYVYDVAGNRTKLVRNGSTFDYGYISGHRLSTVNGPGTNDQAFAWDDGGRIETIARDGQALYLEYTGQDQLKTIADGLGGWLNYYYDAQGRRTRATDSAGGERRYLVAPTLAGDLESPWLVADDNNDVMGGFAYIGATPLMRFDATGEPVYYLEDGMDSVLGLTDDTGSSIAAFRYDGFGNVVTATGATNGIAGVGGDFRFHGHWYEEASGLYHMRARDYDAVTGRFIERDPVEGNARMPESFHPYQFANANPNWYCDPTGLFSVIEINAAGAVQSSMQAFRTAAINRARDHVIDEVVDAFSNAAVRSLSAIFPGVGDLFEVFADGNDYAKQGNLLEDHVLNRFCEIVNNRAGNIAKYIYMYPGLDPESGDARFSGIHCPMRGVEYNKGLHYPDFVLADRDPTESGQTSYFVGDIKLSGNSLYNQYWLNRDDKEKTKMPQFKAMVNFAAEHTYTRMVTFATFFSGNKKKLDKVGKLFGQYGIKEGVLVFVFSAVDNRKSGF